MLRQLQAYLLKITLLLSPTCFAETIPSIGELAENMIAGSTVITRLFLAASVILGVGFIIASITMYKTHRDNPKFIPLDRPVLFLILGLVAISIPFLGKFVGKTGSVLDLQKEAKHYSTIVDIDAPLTRN